MKLIHLSDLHLGKKVNDFSMVEDQRYILEQILAIIDKEKPDSVLIAGDVYDKPVPTVEAVQLLDSFLSSLAERGVQTFVISGNHDSAERMGFAAGLIGKSGIHISPAYTGTEKPFCMKDAFGQVNIYLLPFIKPAHVRSAYPDCDVDTYTEAVREAVQRMEIDSSARNILVAHQFVTGATRAESEEITIGGTDNVDVSVFDSFDYVALGHIHRPQRLTRNTVRYSGTPLKYSFSECHDTKSVTVVELRAKGDVEIRTVPLIPLHDMREIRGTYDEITSKKNYEGTDTQDYVHITLTDEEDILDAAAKLRVIYPNLMKLDYDNARTRNSVDISFSEEVETQSPLELFADLFLQQNGNEMTCEQANYVKEMINEIWESV